MSERTGEHDAACGGCRQRPCVCETVALPKAGDWFRETPESLAALAEERAQLEAAEAIVAKVRCRVSGEKDPPNCWSRLLCRLLGHDPLCYLPPATTEGGERQ